MSTNAKRTIYAHLPPFEVRPIGKPTIWRDRFGLWCCAMKRGDLDTYAAQTPKLAYEGWLQSWKVN